MQTNLELLASQQTVQTPACAIQAERRARGGRGHAPASIRAESAGQQREGIRRCGHLADGAFLHSFQLHPCQRGNVPRRLYGYTALTPRLPCLAWSGLQASKQCLWNVDVLIAWCLVLSST